MITREEVFEALKPIIDPEIRASIVDLGLIYDVLIEPVDSIEVTSAPPAASANDDPDSPAGSNDRDVCVDVHMTLTTPMCPYGPALVGQVTDVVQNLPGVAEGKVTLVWDPPWDLKSMATEELRLRFDMW